MKTFKLLLVSIILSALQMNARALPTFTITNPCTPQVTITPIVNTYGCYSITANNGIVNDPDSYYQWNFENGSSGTGKTIFHCTSPVTVTTNYTLSLTYNSPILCGVQPNVAVYTITLNPPASTLCVSYSPSVSIAANSATVWGGSAIPEIMYSHNFGDGTPPTSGITHTYSTCGNYIIEVQSWNMNTPNDICYSYAAANINCGATTGIDEHSASARILVYPNPAIDFLQIKSRESISTMNIYDVSGREVMFIEKQNTDKIRIDVLPAGLYFVKIQTADQKNFQTRFIKE